MADEPQLTDAPPVPRHFGTERLNALSDGVFAIALTLLVLELKLPEGDEPVLELVADDAHIFLAWLISFVAIARFWMVHHSLTAGLHRCDTPTLAYNFGVLGAVTLVPFSADVLGTERLSEPWSTVVFAANIGLLSLTVGLLARHVGQRQHLLRTDHSPGVLALHRSHHLYLLPALTLTAAALAFVEPYLSVVILIGEFLVFGLRGSRRT